MPEPELQVRYGAWVSSVAFWEAFEKVVHRAHDTCLSKKRQVRYEDTRKCEI